VPEGYRAYTDVDGEVHLIPLNDLPSVPSDRTPTATSSDVETYDVTLTREGDFLYVGMASYSDQDLNRSGYTSSDTSSAQLVRDGVVVAENPNADYLFVDLPPEEATYTFRSGHTSRPTPIPVMAVRFAPDLDDHNAAEAGERFQFPLDMQLNGGGIGPMPAVEISYDDGATWQNVSLISADGRWWAEVDHPADAQFASLRWSATDGDGNTAKVTIIHAYALK
jgi:hypothetical protein